MLVKNLSLILGRLREKEVNPKIWACEGVGAVCVCVPSVCVQDKFKGSSREGSCHSGTRDYSTLAFKLCSSFSSFCLCFPFSSLSSLAFTSVHCSHSSSLFLRLLDHSDYHNPSWFGHTQWAHTHPSCSHILQPPLFTEQPLSPCPLTSPDSGSYFSPESPQN